MFIPWTTAVYGRLSKKRDPDKLSPRNLATTYGARSGVDVSKILGVQPPVFEGRAVENFHFEPQYLENGPSDFRESFIDFGSL